MTNYSPIGTLRNQYFALRHGESLANVAGIIVSDPRRGALPQFGLSDRGRAQVAESVRPWRPALRGKLLICTSPFSRTRETAAIANEALGGEVHEFSELRERFFGELEGTSTLGYKVIWTRDALTPTHHQSGVESVIEVRTRLVYLITEFEERYADRQIVLVSHGDPLQILQTVFDGLDPSEHRAVPPLQTAELRPLNPRAD